MTKPLTRDEWKELEVTGHVIRKDGTIISKLSCRPDLWKPKRKKAKT